MNWKSLPKWTYDPIRDTHRTTSLDELAKNPLDDSPSDDCGDLKTSHAEGDNYDDEGLSSDEDLEDSGDNDIPYVWPSDSYRYEALAYSSRHSPLLSIKAQFRKTQTWLSISELRGGL